ncbi:MAG: helix-turn-helix domain-containing protein [Acidimicrobiia bacterium]|nr:helix-turn-helix domain-containing protein [Acidimicrobiia bacterium]
MPRGTGRAGTPAQGRELRARGRRTMGKLLDAGIQVFARKGYHAARVDDIVKVARTSHGTFYLYFANKEDLFRALVLDVAEELRTVSESIGPIGPDDAGRRALRDWLEQFSALYERYGPVIRTWTEAEVDDTEFGRLGADVLGQMAATLGDRVDGGAGGGRPGDRQPGVRGHGRAVLLLLRLGPDRRGPRGGARHARRGDPRRAVRGGRLTWPWPPRRRPVAATMPRPPTDTSAAGGLE